MLNINVIHNFSIKSIEILHKTLGKFNENLKKFDKFLRKFRKKLSKEDEKKKNFVGKLQENFGNNLSLLPV